MADLWLTMDGSAVPADLPPVPEHLLTPPRVDRGTSPEYGRTAWTWFRKLRSDCGKPEHFSCWGWDVVRVSYEDDARFARAVRALGQLAGLRVSCEYQQHIDTVMSARARGRGHRYGPVTDDPPVISREPNDLIVRYYHHRVFQDGGPGSPGSILNGAFPELARAYIVAHPDWDEHAPARNQCFIFMDKETIDHLASAILPGEPGEPETTDQKMKAAVMHWVKVVDVFAPVEGEGGRQHRLRLWDLLDMYISVDDGLSTRPTWEPKEDGEDDAPAETQRDWPFTLNQYSGIEPRWVRSY
ncbi:hypothetical protein ACHAQA_002673 [Verticillium albo-atrum]